MKPGPVKIIACPSCNSLYKQPTLLSGNTIGAKFWTDGKREAPMLPDYPRITKCLSCDTIFWMEEAKQLGEVAPWDEKSAPKEWQDAPYIEHLEVEDLDKTLSTGKAGEDANKEKYLRVKLWWTINDSVRAGKSSKIPQQYEAIFRRNLEKLIPLLDESIGEDRLMKAEVYRELGDFDKVESLLVNLPDKFVKAVEKIRFLSVGRNTQVAQL